MEIVACPQIAEQVSCGAPVWIVAGVQPRAAIATIRKAVPLAGGEDHTIAIDDVSPGEFASERIQSRVVLWALDPVLLKDPGVSRD